jgi:hypothetical protein
VSNIYASYGFGDNRTGFNWRFLQGLNVGTGFHMESGIPISEYLPHPVYLNAGERKQSRLSPAVDYQSDVWFSLTFRRSVRGSL